MQKTITSASYSRLLDFESCRLKAYFKHVERIPDPRPATAADRGTDVHNRTELFVRNEGEAPKEATKHFKDELDSLKRHFDDGRASLEGEWAFDTEWASTDWKDGWFRMKADAVVYITPKHACVVDYKGLDLATKLPTPTGWTTMADVKVGDELFAQNGTVCTVIGKSKVKNLPCYTITFDDTTTVTCDEEHLWALNDGRVLPVTDLERNMHINVCAPLELEPQKLPIHPYVLGLWIADGKHTSSEITKPDDFIWEEIKACGYEISHDYSAKAEDDKCRVHTVYGIRSLLSELGVLGNKHIPAIYMRASAAQRLDLLQGIMDGDGSVNPLRKQVVLQSIDPELSKQYLELIQSLGQRATRAFTLGEGFGKALVAYPVSFRPNGITPFRLPRKADACADFGPGHSATRRIKSVVRVDSAPTQCIAVDSADHTFLCTERFLPTHNTGKRFGNEIKHGEQTQLYAMATLLKNPTLERVTAELWYFDQNELASYEVNRTTGLRCLKGFDNRAKKMTTATTFPPNPNGFSCRYCPYKPVELGGTGHCKVGV